jgi:mitogen-activated protein kinase 1/3
MSPSHSRRSSNEKRDQLNIIFDLIGTPSTEEISVIADEDVRKYVRCFRERSCTSFRERFSMATEEGLDALRRMLTFSPANRLTVGEAIEHALLKTMRNPELESDLPAPLDLDFETLPDMNFRVMRKYITSEIQKYH